MTQVDFYVLPGQEPSQLETLACRVAEKAWGQGNKVFIHARDEEQARKLDNLLWTFRQGSFIPHELMGRQEVDEATPIRIGYGQDPGTVNEVLINLSLEVPPFFGRFQRVTELVNEQPDIRDRARERYQHYRDRGYALDTHKLTH